MIPAIEIELTILAYFAGAVGVFVSMLMANAAYHTWRAYRRELAKLSPEDR